MLYRNERFKQIEHLNLVFTVIGSWQEAIPEGMTEEGIKGGFTDYRIEHCGVDITEVLNCKEQI